MSRKIQKWEYRRTQHRESRSRRIWAWPDSRKPSRKSDAGGPDMSVLTMLASTAEACCRGLAGAAQLRRRHSLQGVPHRRGRAHSLINGAGLRRSQPHSAFFNEGFMSEADALRFVRQAQPISRHSAFFGVPPRARPPQGYCGAWGRYSAHHKLSAKKMDGLLLRL